MHYQNKDLFPLLVSLIETHPVCQKRIEFTVLLNRIVKFLGHATMRPSELFYAKLTPLLKEAGIQVENRKEWPLSILKKVLLELMSETPKDLLAKLVV